MLCTACSNIFDDKPKMFHPHSKMLYMHHNAAYQIEKASQAGCYICSTLWESLTEEDKDLFRQRGAKVPLIKRTVDSMNHSCREIALRIFYIVVRHSLNPDARVATARLDDHNSYGWTVDHLRGLVIFSFGIAVWKVVAFALSPDHGQQCISNYYQWSFTNFLLDAMCQNQQRFNMLPSPYGSIYEFIGAVPKPQDMGSDTVWDLIQQWCTTCDWSALGHSRCHEHRRKATSAIPTRLVDVMSGEGSDQVRLTVSAEEREPLPYVTLSYTWGGIDQDKLHLLRKDTLQPYRTQIPDGHLPALFRDVIEVVRRLGFRYVWIDAYCIIQQDPVDFQTEAARMGDIYKHAALNIAAGGARNPNSRLMGLRNTTFVDQCQVYLAWETLAVPIGLPTDKPPPATGSYLLYNARYVNSEIVETPLNQRAWVMQEQQLSPRILHFGKNQVFWRCWGDPGQMGQACETFPRGTPIAPGFERAHQYGLQANMSESDRSSFRLDMHQEWNKLVSTYTYCNITKQTDRLVAISGLAANFASALKQDSADYAAGLWKCDLPLSLCWRVDDVPLTRGQRSRRFNSEEPYVGPSWSWVSVKGNVRFMHPMDIRALLEEGWEINFLCSNDFMVAMKPLVASNPYGQVEGGEISFSGYVVPSRRLTWSRTMRARNGAICSILDSSPSIVFCSFDDIDDYERQQKRGVLPLVLFKAHSIDLIPLIFMDNPAKPDDSFALGLVVVREPRTNHFRRIGFFRSSDHTGRPSLGMRAINLLHSMEECANIVLI